ncbi:MAG TPA: DUF1801 domain-containing protein [Gemmatimonadaceae bacterium]|nr:DUF1801 domain-containing protein [Gemmatimonadaceae bacterium]
MSGGLAPIATIDDYLASLPPDSRFIIEEIRRIVKARVPGAVETISYKMPAFKLDRVFFFFAAFKTHIGIYPPVKGDGKLQKALLPYRGEKANLRFPLDEPIPYALIGQVAVALSRERARTAR